ncbi:MAG: polymer-forming cytoskeletal protein [Bacteroidales bacterium]|nr:polymer-forming cytoskeletal protein [Bacteroidales bacterium]MBQ6579023.1 polymer-forming cytoskeletal protein [Bacteroidales bacterium]
MAKVMDNNVNVNDVSRISAGTVIKGEINSPNDIRIDGSFEGKIISKGRVVVGDKAIISGDIICENVDFWGKMTGSLYVKDTLALKEGCVVNGDLHIKRLAVELGSRFDGVCKMLSEGEFDKISGNVVSSKAPSAVKPIVAGTPVSAAGTPVQN